MTDTIDTASPHADDAAFSLTDKFQVRGGRIYLTGIQALIRVLIDQHHRDTEAGLETAGFVSGYPGSPLGGVDLELYRHAALLADHHIMHVPGLNEDLAATAVFGTQMIGSMPDATVDGVFGMWFGKAPGVDRSGDAFRHANYRGTAKHGGVLAVAGDDPDAKSTILPSDSTRAFHDWYMPVLFPGDVQDVLDLGLHGYALSRASGLWCGFKIVTNVADGAGSATVGDDRVSPRIPTVELDGHRFEPGVHPNTAGRGMLEIERQIYHGRVTIAREYGRINHLNPVTVDPARARLGIIAPGRAYFDVRQALDQLGLDDATLRAHGVRLMKVGLMYPMHDRDIQSFAEGLDEVIVVEDKRPFVELAVKDALYGTATPPVVIGKSGPDGTPFLPGSGELTPAIIARALGPRIVQVAPLESLRARLAELDERPRTRIELTTDRTAFFCSGCPHNRSLVVPDGSVVGAGIGCHIMALSAGRDDFGEFAGYTHMGAEGAQWIGMAPFVETPHIFQNLGDGTFFHSGSLAIRWAAATGINITYKLLYNGAVGMTGGQDVQGAMPVPELTRVLAAEGVQRIIITAEEPDTYKHVELSPIAQVRHRDDLLDAQEQLAATPGVTVLIHDQHCAAEKRRLRKRGTMVQPTSRIFVNERVCEDCGDCGHKSNCLSVQTTDTEFGPKTQIHQSSCNFDYSCIDGDCPSFLTIDTSRVTKPTVSAVDEVPEPPPEPRSRSRGSSPMTVHMMGIGGTGVVTVSQILATAATIDGKYVRNLDVTGSSQKAGPVVSQLQLFDDEHPTASTIAEGSADVYLAFDLITAMSPTNLARTAPQRTTAIVSTSPVPTGAMAARHDITYPDVSAMRAELDHTTNAQQNVYLDALAVSERLFGDHMMGNMLLVGVAYQRGVLGIAAAAIEEAIRLNGAAVDKNLAAFRWGRWYVTDPTRLPGHSIDGNPPTRRTRPSARIDRLLAELDMSPDLAHVVDVRARDLVEYQDERYATDYLRALRHVLDATAPLDDGGGDGGDGESIALAAAKGLHKLMAYKDEYEVARLQLDPVVRQQIERQFGPGATVSWNLHPPLLKAIGLKRKVKLGAWFRPAFTTLRALRWLRKTPIDPFGRTQLRRIERELVTHYRSVLQLAMDELSTSNAPLVLELATLPELIRGYEDVKLRGVQTYLQRAHDLCARLGIRPDRPPHLSKLTPAD